MSQHGLVEIVKALQFERIHFWIPHQLDDYKYF